MTWYNSIFGSQQESTPQEGTPPSPSPTENKAPAADPPTDEIDIMELFKDEAPKEDADSEPQLPAIGQVLTPEALKQITAKMNFTQGLPKDIAEGMTDTQRQALEHGLRNVYSAALRDQGSLLDALISQYDQYASKNSEKRVKGAIQEDKIFDHEVLSDPMVQKMVKPALELVKAKYPGYTAKQQQNAALKILASLTEKANGPEKKRQSTKAEKEASEKVTNWLEAAGMKV